MYKAAVFSDTHGNVALMLEAIARTRPDMVIHLGDCERDTVYIRERFPEIPLCAVCGNCDFYPTMPEKELLSIGPVKALLTHGHLYNVKWGTDRLVYAAMEAGASLALYGHTHEAEYTELCGVTLVNPGSAGKGRSPSYALLEVSEDGAVKVDIRTL